MAITDPRAIKFGNELARVCAKEWIDSYKSSKILLAAWASPNGYPSLIPNTTSILADSAAPNGVDATGGDGRPVVTGAQINSVVATAQTLVAQFEANGNALLNTLTAVVQASLN